MNWFAINLVLGIVCLGSAMLAFFVGNYGFTVMLIIAALANFWTVILQRNKQ